ncbi:hypothetical protein GCM10023167_06480 [Brevibacterium pityocampae]|uniref:Uncharacterized protein n=1 Tax=Brevibacterium pityocampae TaxID=506594 RepID=A0ABP8J4T1_9MICO
MRDAVLLGCAGAVRTAAWVPEAERRRARSRGRSDPRRRSALTYRAFSFTYEPKTVNMDW